MEVIDWEGVIGWLFETISATVRRATTFDLTAHAAFTGQSERWTGSLWDPTWFYDTLTVADVDGDGQTDLIGACQNCRPAVLRNNGDGTFTQAWQSSKTDTQRLVAFSAFTYFVDVTGTGRSLIGANGPTNAFQIFSSFGEYWGPNLSAAPPADTVPPVITAPDGMTLEATGPSGAVANFTATALDGVDGSVPVTANPASGSVFPLGTTTVQLSATDAAHNVATASFTVTVQDTTPPTIIGTPANITAEATSAAGAAVTYATPTATDIVDVTDVVTCAPASGSTFPLGTTTVTCSAHDAHHNGASTSFTVTARDTTPPTISSVTPSTGILWPPNKKMVPISIAVADSDAVMASPACQIVSVASNEPGSGQWQITGALTLTLQADRLGTGTGRIYTIGVTCTDAAGNQSSLSTTTVVVPHDMGRK